MDTDSSEIAKLTERIAKDPKSKLFVPLAEEYKKAGDIEMSIHVLTEGLKHNPGYITAKSFLGRLLLEKGDLQGALKEFEDVVKAIPDNLLAQRKLGDIYARLGDKANALARYKAAQSLNPKDEEIRVLIAELESGGNISTSTDAGPAGGPAASRSRAEGMAAQPAPSPPPAGQVWAGGPLAAEQVEEPEEVLYVEPLDEEPAPVPNGSGDFDFLAEGMPPEAPGEAGGIDGQPLPVFEPADQTDTAADVFGADAIGVSSSPFSIPAVEEDKSAPPRAADDLTTNTLAELYISQGFYEKAIDIYERLLAENPDSKALEAKLAQVRAMAGGGAIEAQSVEPASSGSAEEPAMWTPPSQETEPPLSEGFGGFAPPALEPPAETGFEPKPYTPPLDAAPPGRIEEKGHVDVRKKETIERLEQWLKNIMKERQR